MNKETGKMICYYIDSAAQTITAVTFNNISDLRKLVGGYIEMAYAYPNGDVLYVDEEGLLKNNHYGFAIVERSDQGFLGNGVIVGPEFPDAIWKESRSNQNPITPISVVRENIMFGYA